MNHPNRRGSKNQTFPARVLRYIIRRMIGKISGTIAHRGKDYLIIDAGGVGYKVFATRETIAAVGKQSGGPASVWTHLAVREESLDLYGFPDEESLQAFELLLSVSGIGPKSALAILNVASLSVLRSAIASGDASHLTKTTGIGTKKAEKIVLELKDKFIVSDSDIGVHREAEDVVDALTGLGYSRREAQEVLKKIPEVFASTEAKIREALKILGK